MELATRNTKLSHKVFADYRPVLSRLSISYIERGPWLYVGNMDISNKWLVFIGSKSAETLALLEKVIPVLAAEKKAFRVVSDEFNAFRVNSGGFGALEAGKILMITLEENEFEILGSMARLTKDFKSPVIKHAARIDTNLFIVKSVTENNNGTPVFRFIAPQQEQLPEKFKIISDDKKEARRLALNLTIPDKVIHQGFKGDISEGTTLHKLRKTTCIIKEGNNQFAEDLNDRNMSDRLKWQRDVLLDLKDLNFVPKVYKYIRGKEKSYLIIEKIDGVRLDRFVRAKTKGKPWNELDNETKSELIDVYQKVLLSVQILHNRGYLHRDITSTNFIVDNNRIVFIDFELAYSVKRDYPNPAFLLGTFGYASPDQMNGRTPTVSQDLFSLGALLMFFITSEEPGTLMFRASEKTIEKLHPFCDEEKILTAIKYGLDSIYNKHPRIESMIEKIQSLLL